MDEEAPSREGSPEVEGPDVLQQLIDRTKQLEEDFRDFRVVVNGKLDAMLATLSHVSSVSPSNTRFPSLTPSSSDDAESSSQTAGSFTVDAADDVHATSAEVADADDDGDDEYGGIPAADLLNMAAGVLPRSSEGNGNEGQWEIQQTLTNATAERVNKFKFVGGRYQCVSCPKAFKYRHHLRQHVECTHAGMRFHCPACPVAHTRSNTMRVHVRKLHGITLTPKQLAATFYAQPE